MSKQASSSRTALSLSTSASTEVLSKQLPCHIEAEKALIAALLLNPESISLAADILLPKDFYNKGHQILFSSLLELVQAQEPIDAIVLHDLLERKGLLQEAGGLAYLIELQEDIPSIGLVVQHARIIKEKSLLRSLIEASSEIVTSCYAPGGRSIEELIDTAERKIFSLSHTISHTNFVPLHHILKATFKKLSESQDAQGGVTGIATGFGMLDQMTSGMQPGDLIILAARPSMGKTALALNIALHTCKMGNGVGVFSLEMSSQQLVLRMLSAESGISHQKIRNAFISSQEWMDLTDTATKLAEAPLYIDDTPALSIMELRSKARKLASQSRIKLLVIDYLQLIGTDGRHENRNQEIASISRSLKALAKELCIPVLALSQLSRSLESRMDKRPLLSDLRESGAIEQDGDVILFIYRDSVYNKDTEHPDLAEIIIGKQRNGPVGTAYVKFSGDITRFEDMPSSHSG